ncbi:MAG: DUF2786 domain-containing protein [Nannocystaceae bacterium]
MARDTAALLDRVRKLLALATSPNVHEAANAAARAQALIEEHRLAALLEAEAAAEAADEADPITDGVELPLERARKIRKWKIALASGLAEVNGCVAYTAARGPETLLLLAGRAADREAVLAIWEWLVRRIEWLSATAGAGQPREWHESFRIGAADAVCERLAAAVVDARASLETAALARIAPSEAERAAAVETFAAERLRLRPGRRLLVDPDALEQGRVAGARMPLRDRE